MFQHSKAHLQTPLLSLLINPVVQKSLPLHLLVTFPPQPALSSLLPFSASRLSLVPSFVFHYECPGNHQPQVWQKYTKRTGEEPRMRVDGSVGGCVSVCFLSVCACVLLFDQCWQILTSLLCIQLSCFPSSGHLFLLHSQLSLHIRSQHLFLSTMFIVLFSSLQLVCFESVKTNKQKKGILCKMLKI